MAISIFSKEDQASGNFNFGEIKEKNLLAFRRMEVNLNLIQTYFIGHMLGLLIKKARLDYILIKVLKFAVLY